nr:iron-sulfur cluster-binding domain-containing protein [Pseudaminobacter soli]
MALRSDLERRFGHRLKTYFSRGQEAKPLPVHALIARIPADSVVYACGPAGLIDSVRQNAAYLGLGNQVRFELFGVPAPRASDRSIELRLARSDRTIEVAADETILDALVRAGANPGYSCRAGRCGTCAVKVLEGVPDHRDSTLSEAERSRAGLMCICVSRAESEYLVLDL